MAGLGALLLTPLAIRVGERTYYTVQSAEKGLCRTVWTARSQGGHASSPRADISTLKLSQALCRLGDGGARWRHDQGGQPQSLLGIDHCFLQAIGVDHGIDVLAFEEFTEVGELGRCERKDRRGVLRLAVHVLLPVGDRVPRARLARRNHGVRVVEAHGCG